MPRKPDPSEAAPASAPEQDLAPLPDQVRVAASPSPSPATSTVSRSGAMTQPIRRVTPASHPFKTAVAADALAARDAIANVDRTIATVMGSSALIATAEDALTAALATPGINDATKLTGTDLEAIKAFLTDLRAVFDKHTKQS